MTQRSRVLPKSGKVFHIGGMGSVAAGAIGGDRGIHATRSCMRTRVWPGTWRTHGALLFVQLAFGSQAVEAKLAMMPPPVGAGIRPAAVAMVRMLLATLFFQLFARATRKLAPV